MPDAPASSPSSSSPSRSRDPRKVLGGLALVAVLGLAIGVSVNDMKAGAPATSGPSPGSERLLLEAKSDCPGDPAECRRQAMRQLGLDGSEPAGSPGTDAASVLLLRAACTLGDDTACNLALGLMWDRSTGSADGWSRFELACANGAPAACNEVGTAHFVGGARPRDGKRAFKFFERSCELRDDTPNRTGYMGCTWVGGMYQLGRGVAANRKQMGQHYGIACGGADGDPTTDGDRGDPLACDILRTIIGAETGDRDLYDENLIGLSIACASMIPHAGLACAVVEDMDAKAPQSAADQARDVARSVIRELEAKWDGRSPGTPMVQACDSRIGSITTSEGRSAFRDEFWRYYTPKPAVRYEFYNNCVELWPN